MKVLLGLLLGYSVLILAHELPDLPRTQHPPKSELSYWCTYVPQCDFCWDCQDGICKNKITESRFIDSNHSIVNCRVFRDSKTQSCLYEISSKMPNHFNMECLHPRPYTGNEIFMRTWGGVIIGQLSIKQFCLYFIIGIAYTGCFVCALCKNLRLRTTMKLFILLSILVWLAQPVLNRPLSIFYTKQILPRTYTPPMRELEYWCTYGKHCDFCWDCKNGICKNKVLDDMPLIVQNDYISKCSITRFIDRCMYFIEPKIPYIHYMNCSLPTYFS
uniref:p110_11L n=1 Tax=African swine fever virus TaxID=10497 RepID=A0A6G7KTP7_ASF